MFFLFILEMEDESAEGNIAVSLEKRKLGGLGFIPTKRASSPYLAISDLVKGSAALESGLLHAGDVIVEIDGKSVEDIPYDNILETLEKVPTGGKVNLKVRAKDGYRAFVETTFSQEGPAKTVRTTTEKDSPKTRPTMNKQVNGAGGETTCCVSTDSAKEKESESEIVSDAKRTATGEAVTTDVHDNAKREEVGIKPASLNTCPAANSTAKPQQPKYVRLQNLLDGSYSRDTLHQTANIIVSLSPIPIHLQLAFCFFFHLTFIDP